MDTAYDVIVVGGGTAGVIAAVQAGRADARTLLVEKQGILGGTLVVGGIHYPASFFAYDKQVVAGIGWELCCRVWEELGQPIPRPAVDGHRGGGQRHERVNPAVYAALADEMLEEAGVDMLLHAMPAGVSREEDLWKLALCTKTGLRRVEADVLIDCTGDANVVEMAGLGVKRNPEIQSATLVVHAGGYDAQSLDYDAIQDAFEKEVEAGRMKHTDPGWNRGRIDFFLKSYGGNRIHVTEVDARTSEGKTEAEIEGRRAMMRLLRFFRRQPGLEEFTIESCATECGIRETVTIEGKKEITVEDYEGGRMWEDAVCYSFYPIDVHRADHILGRPLERGIYPTIPLGALLPAGSRRIIVAGRCAAGDWEANSSYRVEVPCMAMGQAAGAGAALAVERGVDFEDLPIEDIHALLREHEAVIPGDID